MDNSLTPETQQRIRSLCGEIAVAHDIDPGLREELCGHVEDKMLAYLSGEEAVSEADALLLAREHFGDQARLKALLSKVHCAESAESLWRRMAAGGIVILGAFLVLSLLRVVLPWVGEGLSSVAAWMLVPVAGLFPVLVWRILAQWRIALRHGQRPWFVRWRPSALATCALVLPASFPFVMFFAALLKGVVRFGTLSPGGDLDWLRQCITAFEIVVACEFLVLMPGLWMWWCDERPRRPGAMQRGVLVWSLALFYILFNATLFVFVPGGYTFFDSAPVLLALNGGKLLLAPALFLPFPEAGRWLALTFALGAGTALLGWFVHGTARAARIRFARIRVAEVHNG